jgi:hypothetical protein
LAAATTAKRLRNEENQFAFYEAMEKFFAQHLKP